MSGQSTFTNGRRDLITTTDQKLSKAMADAKASVRKEAVTAETAPAVEPIERLAIRRDLLEPRQADPTGFERIIGESDLTSINYLERGKRAAAAVCRIRVPSPGGEWYGTGFLVGPRLLMTNAHVLGNEIEAGQAEAEFGYEHDVDGVLGSPIQYNLMPHEIFFSDPQADVTFVSVAPVSDKGIPLERFGWLSLLPLSGKAVEGEWVTIIQHPGGGPKQISIRANQIVNLDVSALKLDSFIHYLTDTEPGSSGSPVLNDQWQVVALHHKAVAAPADPAKPTAPVKWIGNEGVRISAIFKLLERHRLDDDDALRVLDRLERALGFTPMVPEIAATPSELLESDGKPYKTTRWTKQNVVYGYDPDFLSETLPLDDIIAPVKGQAAPLLSGTGVELVYNKFSVVMHADRKFALITAVNINGSALRHPGDRPGSFRRDARIANEYQPDGEFYEKAKGKDKIQFSRGHLVRRFDPAWGESDEEARDGDADSFHYTNAAPQFQTYNNVDWGNLEDYVLNQTQLTERKVTVFQGPIYRHDDPPYGKKRKGGPWKIPLSFWKIAVVQKTATTVSAAAFIVGQTQYVNALYEAKVFKALAPYRFEELRTRKIQTTIATIEQETGLNFERIRPFDAHDSLESTRRTRWLTSVNDILI
ncbi:DNA/RNA non-specific endonuclease [Rhizobium mongolense]|uniref:Endonuclease G n=2 Tax=Rhizobium mongolense TaxID=57676 RepID=A0ABR6IW79_9HYPH|nr:DNA/RNA non-specific endonuclease [Rhizobium mongolense]MBB4232176.1 endonuclease G [Rhizobium mongolense]TVZ63104.1 endonuclease G [Rhizobium mongolense USDA 1844]